MSYLNCRQGHCEACNGYIGPLDTFACLHSCHDRADYVCSQQPHPGAEFYREGGCGECSHTPADAVLETIRARIDTAMDARHGGRCECGRRTTTPDELESGLCLRCLNGPNTPTLAARRGTAETGDDDE